MGGTNKAAKPLNDSFCLHRIISEFVRVEKGTSKIWAKNALLYYIACANHEKGWMRGSIA